MSMNKAIKLITSKDIQRFVNSNCGVLNSDEEIGAKDAVTVVSPATVDRELDLISQVIRWATNKEGVKGHKDPMAGVKLTDLPRHYALSAAPRGMNTTEVQ
jgi:hypothetical protein